MGVSEVIEILLTFVQYFALINSVDVDFPEVWSVPTDWTNWAALNLRLDIPWLPETDFRGSSLSLCVCVCVCVCVFVSMSI